MQAWVKPAYRNNKPYALGKSAARQGLARLASNENPYGPSLQVGEALRAAAETSPWYPDADCLALRAQLAAHLEVDASQVIVSNGSNALIELVSRVGLSPGDEALLVDPCFQAYAMAAAWNGATVRSVALQPNFEHEVGAILAAMNHATKLVFLANPNNPTGTYLTGSQLDTLLREAPAHVLIVVDEAYFEYAVAPDYPNATQMLSLRERTLVLRTFSKAYGLAGLRVGYGVGPSALIGCMHHARMPFNVGGLAQVAAQAALADQAHIVASRSKNREQMAFLAQALRARKQPFAPSQANFLLVDFGDMRDVTDTFLSYNVLIRSMASYSLPTWQRVTVGSAQDNALFVRALDHLIDCGVGSAGTKTL